MPETTPSTAPTIPPEHMTAFKSAIAEITREQIDEKVKELHAKAATGVLKTGPGSDTPKMRNQAFYDLYDPLKGKGAALGQYFKAHLIASKSGKTLETVVKELEGTGRLDGFVAKALMETNFADGGSVVRPEISSDWIELIRAALVFSELGIVKVPMAGLELIFNRQDAPATATFRGEMIAIIPSQLKTGQLKLQKRELSVLVPVSDNLLNDGGPLLDQMIRDDLVAVYALRAELAGLRGDGSSDTPIGLRYGCDQTNNVITATQAGAEATFDEIGKDLAKLIRRVKGVNGKIKRPGFIITPRVEEALETVSSTFGVYPFREQLEAGKIRGFPFRTTTQIPENLGVGANETEVYLTDFAEYYMAEGPALAVESFRGATIQGADGNPIYGINQGMTAIRGTGAIDFGLRHKQKAAVLTGCRWGASFG
jgi:HK97 family phage major capsid protein